MKATTKMQSAIIKAGVASAILRFRHVGDERTHEDVASHSSRGVEHTTDLNQLVTAIAATAEEVEHGVHPRS